jgi:hypothetical protein
LTVRKRKSFTVTAYIKTLVERQIDADTLTDAVEKAKGMTPSDFITVDGELADQSFIVQGVSDPDPWTEINK